jgi:hypothetical protein
MVHVRGTPVIWHEDGYRRRGTYQVGGTTVHELVSGHSRLACKILGHSMMGSSQRVQSEVQLPRFAWCMRCTLTWVQTDVPEAYGQVV